MKIGILGGSFDPVHYGHLILAEQIKDRALLDEVVLVPAFVSPFKTDEMPAAGEDRLEMLKLAVSGCAGLSVSDIELLRPEPSYTYDTLCRLSGELPGDELYFICGCDSFLGIRGWHRSGELLARFRFIVGTRPGSDFSAAEELARELREEGALDIRLEDIPELEISSTKIRDLVNTAGSIRFLVPEPVREYIESRKIYTDIRGKLLEFVRGNVKPGRFRHTVGTLRLAEKLAERYGEDVRKAQIAAIYHDACRDAGNLEHGPAAAERIQSDFGVLDEDIVNAIRWHTTGRPGMSRLEKLIYVADSLEPGRSFDGIEELRALMYDDLDRCLYALMINTRDYVRSLGLSFDSRSEEAIADLEHKIKGEENG